jgi:hypothetical protein
MQHNTCHNQNIKLIITILQSIILYYMSLQELKWNSNSNSNLNCKLIKQKIKNAVTVVGRFPSRNPGPLPKSAWHTRACGLGRSDPATAQMAGEAHDSKGFGGGSIRKGTHGGVVRVNMSRTPHSLRRSSRSWSTCSASSPALMAPSSLNLVLLLLVTSSSVKPYPLALIARRCSPSSPAAHWLGPTVESHDPGTRPLPDGVVKWANWQSNQLSHGLLRSGDVPESEGPSLLEGSADSGW